MSLPYPVNAKRQDWKDWWAQSQYDVTECDIESCADGPASQWGSTIKSPSVHSHKSIIDVILDVVGRM